MTIESETRKRRFPGPRWARKAGIVLVLVALLVTLLPGRRLPAFVREVRAAHALSMSYLFAGGLRSDLLHVRDCAEYLFFPESGIGARLEFNLDD